MRDDDFWKKKMQNQLTDFYKNDLLNEIVQPKLLSFTK